MKTKLEQIERALQRANARLIARGASRTEFLNEALALVREMKVGNDINVVSKEESIEFSEEKSNVYKKQAAKIQQDIASWPKGLKETSGGNSAYITGAQDNESAHAVASIKLEAYNRGIEWGYKMTMRKLDAPALRDRLATELHKVYGENPLMVAGKCIHTIKQYLEGE